jgi:hypothetical protein
MPRSNLCSNVIQNLLVFVEYAPIVLNSVLLTNRSPAPIQIDIAPMKPQFPSDQHPTALTGPPDPISEPGTSEAIPLQPMRSAPADDGEVASAEARTSQPQSQPLSRQDLKELRVRLKGMLSAKEQGEDTLRALHSLLGEAIGDSGSHVAHRLQSSDARAVRDLEACLLDSTKVDKIAHTTLTMLDELDAKFENQSNVDWAKEKVGDVVNWLGDRVDSGTAASIGAVGLAMVFKNIAWYASRAIPMQGVSPEAGGALASRVAARWAAANFLAVTTEYPFTVRSQRMWKSLGHSMNTWLGIAQGFDMVSALVALKITGDNIDVSQGLALASAAAAVMVQTGMMNGLARRITGRNNGGGITPVENLPAETDSPQRGAGDEEQGVELDSAQRGAGDEEQGHVPPLPMGNEARRQAAKIRHLAEAFPEPGWKAKREQLQELGRRLEDLGRRLEDLEQIILEQIMRPIVPTHTESSETEQPTEDNLRPIVRTHAESSETEQPRQDNRLAIVNDSLKAFDAYRKNLSRLVDNPSQENIAEEGVAAETDKVNHLLEEMQRIRTDLDRSGGTDPKTIAFFAGMASTYIASILAGNIGGAVKSTSLQDLNVRATLNAVGSVPAQTFANLGHLLFKDNPARSERTQNFISILRAIGPTPAEFVPLQWAISLSDMAKSLAGKVSEAPAQNWPSLPEVRSLQELTRQVINVGFNVIALGEKVRAQHIGGLIVNVVGTAAATAAGAVRARLQASQPARQPPQLGFRL